MICPVCEGEAHVEVDTHADGFAQNLQECGDCGALWTRKGKDSILIHGAIQMAVDGARSV